MAAILTPSATDAQAVNYPKYRAHQHEPFLVRRHPLPLHQGPRQDPGAEEEPVSENAQGVEIALAQQEDAGGPHAVAIHGAPSDAPRLGLPFMVDDRIRLVTDAPACPKEAIEQVHVYAALTRRAWPEAFIAAIDAMEPFPLDCEVVATTH